MIPSQIELQDLYLLSGLKQFKSDTSVLYDDLPKNFTQYTIDRMGFDDTYKLAGSNIVVFQFAVADNSGSTTAGRAIWIEIPPSTKDINIISTEIGNIVVFEYPGKNKSLYMKRNETWELVSPISSNMVWLSVPLFEIQELAIINGTIEKGAIIHRRVFHENSFTK